MRFKNLTLISIILLSFVVGTTRADLIWNELTNWVAITSNSEVYADEEDENPATIDLIGNSDHAAGFWQLSEGAAPENDTLAFRLRVADIPNNPQNTWQILIDTDGDSSNVEWILQLNYSGKDSGVFLTQTVSSDGDPATLSLADIQTQDSNAWEGSTEGFSRMLLAGTNLDSKKEDAFIDFGIPWEQFKTLTGVESLNNLRIAPTTSTTHTGVNKDAPFASGDASNILISDTLSDIVPEPSVLTLTVSVGTGMIFYHRARRRKQKEEPPA